MKGDERGFTIVFVAVLITALIAMAGLVINVGAIHAERRELQNGADAAALALAQRCAANWNKCFDPDAERAEATLYASSNARDGTTAVDGPPTHPPHTDPNVQQVRVAVSTREPGGETILPFRFGQPGQTVRAAATAAWGPPSRAVVYPIAMSYCEFDAFTNDGMGGRVFDEPSTTHTYFIHSRAPGPSTPCEAVSPARDADGDGFLDGGFGWTKLSDSGECEIELSVDGWVDEHPLAPTLQGDGPAECIPTYDSLFHNVILIAVFDDAVNLVTGLGKYHVAGFAAFFVTKYHFGGGTYAKPPSGPTRACRSRQNCISGYFSADLVAPGVVGGPAFGPTVVQLVA